MYIAALLTALFGLLIICVWVVIAGLEHRRELDHLEDDYLRRNDSFINPKVNISDTIEDLEKEERFFNYLNKNEKKNNN